MASVAIIVTILNEERTLASLFVALEKQTRKPDEVVIVDGGSTDGSRSLLENWKPDFKFTFLVKKGNRSVGRNAAISKAKSEIIAITDAGCVPEPSWLKNLVTPIEKGKARVVAGYYKPITTTPFEQAASAYMLVMPEKVNPNNFLPATRSMAIQKSVWKKLGEFPEAYSHNEDYVFANRLRMGGIKLSFVRAAVVGWRPPSSWSSFIKQVSRFAYGDMEAGIVRPKVLTIFIRWALLLTIMSWKFNAFVALLCLYCLWAYLKNRKYVPSLSGPRILPLMQVTTDFVIMWASLTGLWKRLHEKTN